MIGIASSPSAKRPRRLLVYSLVLNVVLLAAIGLLLSRVFFNTVDRAFMRDTIQISIGLADNADADSQSSIDNAILGIRGYYPSGARLTTGSWEDLTTELVRDYVIRSLEARRAPIN